MTFVKGVSGNPNGRPKDSVKAELKEKIELFCLDNLNHFLESVKEMRNGHAKATAFIALLNFILPKAVESKFSISNLNEAEINEILEQYSRKLDLKADFS